MLYVYDVVVHNVGFLVQITMVTVMLTNYVLLKYLIYQRGQLHRDKITMGINMYVRVSLIKNIHTVKLSIKVYVIIVLRC